MTRSAGAASVRRCSSTEGLGLGAGLFSKGAALPTPPEMERCAHADAAWGEGAGGESSDGKGQQFRAHLKNQKIVVLAIPQQFHPMPRAIGYSRRARRRVVARRIDGNGIRRRSSSRPKSQFDATKRQGYPELRIRWWRPFRGGT
jgi:hypothetical protein